MNQKHVPSLEHCQEFDTLCKEKGIVVPETEFYYKRFSPHSKNYDLCDDGDEQCIHSDNKKIPAPLVSEQGEWLPWYLSTTDEFYLSVTRPNETDWSVEYSREDRGDEYKLMHMELANTEANARQKSINYLIAEGIITKL